MLQYYLNAHVIFVTQMNTGFINMAPFNEAFDVQFENVNSVEYKIKKINKRLKILEKTMEQILERLNKDMSHEKITLESYKPLDMNDHIINPAKIGKCDDPIVNELKHELRELTKKDRGLTKELMAKRLKLRDEVVHSASRNNYLFYSKALKSALSSGCGLDAYHTHRGAVYKNEYDNIK